PVATRPARKTSCPLVVILLTTTVCVVDGYDEHVLIAPNITRITTCPNYQLFRLGTAPAGPTRKPLARRARRQSGDHPSDEPQSGKENSRMKIHLPWIRATATAVLVAGVAVHPAAAQYAPYRPTPQQPP